MASITVCSRIQVGKVERKKVDGILLAEDVEKFRSKVAEEFRVQRKTIELIYCGRILKDNQTLDSYGVKPGVTVHVLPKRETPDWEIAEKMDSKEIQQVITALQSAMLNPAYRTTIDVMLNDPEALENIIVATPGLDRDPVAIGMLQDAEMLAVMADPDQVHRIIEEHPALGQAAMLVAAAVNEEGAKGNSAATSASARATYSLDQMSDDEDMPSQRIGAVQPGGGASQMITTSQLAAALAAATGSGLGMASSSSTDASPGTSGSTQQGPSIISSDLFRQAMMESGLAQPAASSEEQQQATEAQLAQLRDMGITDERVAREALQATNGDIQAALELIFGDGGFS